MSRPCREFSHLLNFTRRLALSLQAVMLSYWNGLLLTVWQPQLQLFLTSVCSESPHRGLLGELGARKRK